MNPTQTHTITSKGVFLPTWIVVVFFAPTIAGGVGAVTWTAKTLIEHGQQLVQIQQKIDSGNGLLLQTVGSHEKRIDRIENTVFK